MNGMTVVEPPPVKPTPKPGNPFQFSLWALLVLTTVVALFMTVAVLIPNFLWHLAILLFLIVVVPGAVAIPTIITIYATIKYRVFSIGILAGFVAGFLTSEVVRMPGGLRVLFLLVCGIVGGFFATAAGTTNTKASAMNRTPRIPGKVTPTPSKTAATVVRTKSPLILN